MYDCTNQIQNTETKLWNFIWTIFNSVGTKPAACWINMRQLHECWVSNKIEINCAIYETVAVYKWRDVCIHKGFQCCIESVHGFFSLPLEDMDVETAEVSGAERCGVDVFFRVLNQRGEVLERSTNGNSMFLTQTSIQRF